MENRHRTISTWAIPILIGVVVGLIAALISLFFMANARKTVLTAHLAETQAARPTRPFATITSTMTATPEYTSTPTPSLTPRFDLEEVLDDAQDDIDDYDFGTARENLLPLIDQVSDLKSLSEINALIGDAYSGEGLYRMANYYYELAYTQQGNPKNLYKLALTYSATGQTVKALEKFEALLAYPGSDADEYREIAEDSLSYLRMYTGTITPTP